MNARHLAHLITPRTRARHRATWWVYTAPGQRIRHESTMRGTWGYDVTCSCTWDSRTGGATRGSVADALWGHRYEMQGMPDVAAMLGAKHRESGRQPFGAPGYVRDDAGSADLLNALGVTTPNIPDTKGELEEIVEAYCTALEG